MEVNPTRQTRDKSTGHDTHKEDNEFGSKKICH